MYTDRDGNVHRLTTFMNFKPIKLKRDEDSDKFIEIRDIEMDAENYDDGIGNKIFEALKIVNTSK